MIGLISEFTFFQLLSKRVVIMNFGICARLSARLSEMILDRLYGSKIVSPNFKIWTRSEISHTTN